MKRSLALILASLLLVSAAVSCSDNGKNSETEPETTSTNSSETAGEVTEPDAEAETEEETDNNIRSWEGLTFGGAEINIVGRTEAIYAIDFFAEEYTGEAINDAVYSRNAKVEDDLEIMLIYENGSSDYNTFHSTVQNSVSAGDGAYDIVSSYAYYGASMSLENLFTNLHELPNVELSNTWYNQSFVNDMTINGCLDFIIGDLTLTATDRMFITFLNKDLAANYIPDTNLYDVVYEGKWTIDYLSEIVSSIYEDTDGNGKKTPADTYGFAFNTGSVPTDGFITSLGINVASRDAEGNLVITLFDDNANTAFEKLTELVRNNEGTALNMDQVNMFIENRAMLMMECANLAKYRLRDFDSDYGILPLPKLTEAQEKYLTTSQDAYNLVAVTTTCKNFEATGAALEYLSALSQSDVYPTYFETTFQKQYMRSEEDSVMFDYIRDGLTFNVGVVYSNSIANPAHLFRNCISDNTSYATAYKKSSKIYSKSLDKFLDLYAEKAGE